MTAPLTPARAARRQLLRDRFAEYLTDHGAKPEHAEHYARDLLDLVDGLGFRLPAAIEDAAPPAVDPAPDDSPGRRAFAEARAALARRRTDTTTHNRT